MSKSDSDVYKSGYSNPYRIASEIKPILLSSNSGRSKEQSIASNYLNIHLPVFSKDSSLISGSVSRSKDSAHSKQSSHSIFVMSSGRSRD